MGTSNMNRIVDGSELHGRINIVSDAPGHPTKFPTDPLDPASPEVKIDYVEQLLEPDFKRMHGISDARAAEILEAVDRNPTKRNQKIVAEQISDEDGEGVGFLVEDLDGSRHPIGSDYDLISFDVEGLPPGISKGDVDAFFFRDFNQLDRAGKHMWSAKAADLSENNLELATEYVIASAHPERRIADAARHSAHFEEMLGFKVDKRDSLLSKIDDLTNNPPVDQRRLAELQRALAKTEERIDDLLEGLAPSTPTTPAGKFSTEGLLRAFPVEEKLLVFANGKITVGSSSP